MAPPGEGEGGGASGYFFGISEGHCMVNRKGDAPKAPQPPALRRHTALRKASASVGTSGSSSASQTAWHTPRATPTCGGPWILLYGDGDDGQGPGQRLVVSGAGRRLRI